MPYLRRFERFFGGGGELGVAQTNSSVDGIVAAALPRCVRV
jgi:hypothetical protein